MNYDDQLKELAEGSESVFITLYNQYREPVYRYILKYVHSSELAEDLCQEIFLQIWEKRQQLSHVRSFKAYLFISARNHTLNTLNAAFRKEAAITEILSQYPINDLNNTLDDLINKEYSAFLHKVLKELPTRTREVFRLCREQGRSYEEAANALKISRNAIKNHMVSAMKILGSAVEKDLGISLAILVAIFLK